MQHIKNSIAEVAAMYQLTKSEERLLGRAATLLDTKIRNNAQSETMSSPDVVRATARSYFALTHAHKELEVFTVMYLDGQHRLIATVEAFVGTIDCASIYPREIVKQALSYNAAVVIFAHNHPSGAPEPSKPDIQITTRLTDALALIGVRVLDHIIVGRLESFSFAEHGLI